MLSRRPAPLGLPADATFPFAASRMHPPAPPTVATPLAHRPPATALARWQETLVLAAPALAFALVLLVGRAAHPVLRPAAHPPARGVATPVAATVAAAGVLRVCADPNNLPFSNARGEGFENRLAQLVATELGRRVEYTWWAQRRGHVRNTLKAGLCDVIVGIPTSVDMVLATRPYYRSTYVFVTRHGRGPRVRSFDDAVLHHVRVGVQMIGDDFANTPPAHALSKRGIIRNVTGYNVYGDYARPNPTAGIVTAVADGEVDVAVVWGPLAGYFAPRQRVALDLAPVSPQVDLPFLPFVFDISMGVRRGDTALHDQLDAILVRRRSDIDRLLADYGVPRVDAVDGAAL